MNHTDKRARTIFRLKRFSRLCACIAAAFLLIGLLCLALAPYHAATAVVWSLLGLSLAMTAGLSVVWGLMAVKRRLM